MTYERGAHSIPISHKDAPMLNLAKGACSDQVSLRVRVSGFLAS